MTMPNRQETQKEVLKFIARFTNNGQKQEVIDTFTSGCCYWFASVLYERFADNPYPATIVYDPYVNHWACEINYDIYDIMGLISEDSDYEWCDWLSYVNEDAAHTRRLYRDCINF